MLNEDINDEIGGKANRINISAKEYNDSWLETHAVNFASKAITELFHSKTIPWHDLDLNLQRKVVKTIIDEIKSWFEHQVVSGISPERNWDYE
jgi:hypothetical protein